MVWTELSCGIDQLTSEPNSSKDLAKDRAHRVESNVQATGRQGVSGWRDKGAFRQNNRSAYDHGPGLSQQSRHQ